MSGERVKNEHAAISRALRALESAAGDERGDDAHPGIEVLEAYVEGRLPPEARVELDRLAARSSIVAEDLADLQAVHDSLAARTVVARRNIQWGRLAAAAGIAASVVIGVWLTSRPAIAPSNPMPTSMPGLSEGELASVNAALSSGRLVLPERVSSLIGREGTLLGAAAVAAPARLAPLAPLGTAVRSARPSLTWTNAGADAYTVAIFDESFTEVARSPRVAGTAWTPEADLPRGVTYLWQVTAHRGAVAETEPQPPRSEARFVVLDAVTLARVEELEQRLAEQPLMLGILLAESGLFADARAAFTRAAASTPGTAEAAQRLLDSLDSLAPAQR